MGRVLLLALLLASSAVAANAPASRAESSVLTDYDQQALYIVKLGLSYVEWPRLVYSGEIKNIDICVIGDSPAFIKSLRNFQAAAAKKLKINIISAGDNDSLNNCNIAYIPQNKANFKDTISKTRNIPVLTVSPISGFAANGGMIELAVKEVSTGSGGAPVNTKVTVNLLINNKSATAANIKIAPELLESASEVIR